MGIPIIEEGPSFAQRLSQGLTEGLQKGVSQGMNFSKQLALESQKAKRVEKAEDLGRFFTGLDTIGAMRQLVEKGNLGRGSGFMGLFGGETAKDRQEFEQYGKSLIPLVASGVPIRNQKEFEEYKKAITDPSTPDNALYGALDGLERIFKNKISQDKKELFDGKGSKKPSVKFDISNPKHKKRRDQVLKKTKGDREKAAEILGMEFEL